MGVAEASWRTAVFSVLPLIDTEVSVLMTGTLGTSPSEWPRAH